MLRLLILALAVTGCSKRSFPPAEDTGPVRDAPAADWTPPDLAPPHDAAPDTPSVPPGCAALASYAKPKAITSLRARQALLRDKLDKVLLVTWQPQSSVGEIVSISIPGPFAPLALGKGFSNIEWLDPGQSKVLARKPTGPQTYELVVFSPDGGTKDTIATDVCGHRISAGGDQILAVRNCTQGKGTLERVHPKNGTKVWLADGVTSFGVVLSPDGKWAAFVADVTTTRGCSYQRGMLQTMDNAGKVYKGVSEVLDRSIQVLPGSKHVVFRRRSGPGCKEADIHLERVEVDAPSSSIKLASELAFGYPWDIDPDRRYSVSPDGKLLLAAKLDMVNAKAQLVAVNTSGGNPPALLAGDLFPFQMISMAFRPFALSASGAHAVYASLTIYPEMGLSVVPSAGGKAIPLSPKIAPGAYTVSRASDFAAYIEQPTATATNTKLWLATLKTGAAQMRHSSAGSLTGMRFVPDGRGLLFVESTSGAATLRYVSATGPAKTASLGGWFKNHLGPLPFHVDPGACAAVYDSDQGEGGGGTFLALIPR
jgi:hypothetical protein